MGVMASKSSGLPTLASTVRTLTLGFSAKRPATTLTAVPPPRTMKSKRDPSAGAMILMRDGRLQSETLSVNDGIVAIIYPNFVAGTFICFTRKKFACQRSVCA